jgi:hypothetical protein
VEGDGVGAGVVGPVVGAALAGVVPDGAAPDGVLECELGAGVTWTPQAASPAATEPATIALSSARREIALSLVTLAR